MESSSTFSSSWMEISILRGCSLFCSPHPTTLSYFILLLFLEAGGSPHLLLRSLSFRLSSASFMSSLFLSSSFFTAQPSMSTVRRGTLHLEYSDLEFKTPGPLRSIRTASANCLDKGSLNVWITLNLNLGGESSSG